MDKNLVRLNVAENLQTQIQGRQKQMSESEGEFKKHSKSGESIHDWIDGCFYRHCRTLYNMHEDEVPAYEKESKELDEERWISEKWVDEARKDFPDQNDKKYWASSRGKTLFDWLAFTNDYSKVFLKWFGPRKNEG